MFAHICLGYPTYAAYLKSDVWRTIRARVLARDGYACRDCGVMEEPLAVHHTRYEVSVLEGSDDTALLTLCRPCHQARHHPQTGDAFPHQPVVLMASPRAARLRPRLVTEEEKAVRAAETEAYVNQTRARLARAQRREQRANSTTSAASSPEASVPPVTTRARRRRRATAANTIPRRGVVIVHSSAQLRDVDNWSSKSSGQGRRRRSADSFGPE